MAPPLMRRSMLCLSLLGAGFAAQAADPISILFVGNSYTFGRTPLNPDGTLNTANNVLTYNAANVRDLTKPQGPTLVAIDGTSPAGTPKFTNVFGTNSYPIGLNIPGTNPPVQGNSYSPHTMTNTWGGTAGIFKQFTVQAGLNYDVALSTRNAASLRGHLANTANPSNWDLRGNIGSQVWNKVVLQEQSDEALGPKTVNGIALGSNLPSVRAYVDLIEDWVHTGKVTIGTGTGQTGVTSYTEKAMFDQQYGNTANCIAAGGTSGICGSNTTRNLGLNANASLSTQVYLQETWARPDLINAPGTKTLNSVTASATYDTNKPVPSYFNSLEAMTEEMVAGVQSVVDFAAADGSSGIAGIVPTGRSFLRAVQTGVATRNMYANGVDAQGRLIPDGDGLIDLWFDDGTHPSVWGSYLSALTVFGSVTGVDPQSLGRDEKAALDLGISQADAWRLQQVAAAQLGFAVAVPEPSTWALMAAGLGLLAWRGRQRLAG